jgi:acyl-CoA thioester hydrolase
VSDEAGNIVRSYVRVHQTDMTGVMYHGAYFDVFDDARIETFRRLDCTYATSVAEGWTPIIRRVRCEYLRPARMDDLLAITVWIERLGRASMLIRYECRRADDLLAVGRVEFAFLDATMRPVRVPASVRTAVEVGELLAPTPH